MKKLMFAAALAAVGSAFAIESANIVGYQDKECPAQAFYMLSSTFITTGTQNDEFSIQELLPKLPVNAVYPIYDDGATIQELNDQGIGGIMYHWMEPPELSSYALESWYEGAGWYVFNENDGTYTKSDKTFKRGEGFIYFSPWAVGDEVGEIILSSYLQSAGEVALEAKTLTFRAQAFYALANYRPIEMGLQKLVPSLHKDAVYPIYDDGATIQELNDQGIGGTMYHWMEPPELSAYALEPWYEGAGWYIFNENDGTYTKSDKVLAAGEGFIYFSPWAVGDEGGEIFVDSYLTFEE